jgi:hypothetical protein
VGIRPKVNIESLAIAAAPPRSMLECNMLAKTSPAKPEVSTLQKTGSFYFALTTTAYSLTLHIVSEITAMAFDSGVRSPHWRVAAGKSSGNVGADREAGC